MEKNSPKKIRIAAMLCSLFSAAGTAFILFAYCAGSDDILSMREWLILGAGTILTAGCVFFLLRKLPVKTILLAAGGSILLSAACNFEFPELMKLPVQLPAENMVTVAGIDADTSLSMTWAYRFRPRTQNGDPFVTNPDRDIPFSQLIRNGDWDDSAVDGEPVLTAHTSGSRIGIPAKFRTGLAVLCFKAEGGAVTLDISGRDEPVIISEEMTAGQPYRIILQNGLLPGSIGNPVQIFMWSGGFMLMMACGMALCKMIADCRGNRKNIVICLSSFLIPCLVMLILCLFLKITPFGEKSFLINDMWGQYADYMAYLRSVLRGENDLFYSFSKSLGDDFLSLAAYYLTDPLNWLVCLFSPENLPLAVTILVILRCGICGLTASVYFVRRRNCGVSAILFSVCYALMSFNIVNAENTHLREGAMILPLVIMGLEQLAEGRSSRCYVWSLTFAVLLNFYSGYQIILFGALYYLCYNLSRDTRISVKRQFLRFLFPTLMAAGISAFLLVPTALQLQNGPKGFDPSIFSFRINMPWTGLFGKLLASAYDIREISEGFPSLYTGLFCAVLLILYFTSRGIPLRKKISTALLLGSSVMIMQINPLNLILHGFNAPLWWPYRYSFIICFFLIITAKESYAHRGTWTVRDFLLPVLLSGLLIFFLSHAGYSWMPPESIRLNSVLLLAYMVILTCGRSKTVPFAAFIFALAALPELFFNASHILSINTAFERSNTIGDYRAFYEENSPLIGQIKTADNGFYRIEKTYSRTPNDPMLFNYHGITHYSSTINRHIMEFLSQAGFRLNPPYRIDYWEGSDIAMDSLLGIKYLVSGSHTEKPYSPVISSGTHTVYENPYALPLMFTASASAADAGLNGEEGFELQNRIFSALTGEDIRIFIPAETEAPELTDLVTDSSSGETCYLGEEAGDSSLSWKITPEDSGPLYVFFPAEDTHLVRLGLDRKNIGYYFDSSSYHIMRIGTFNPGKSRVLKMTLLEDRVCFRDAQFYHEDLNALERAVSILREDKTELEKAAGSHLTGSFSASSGKMLFFSIPYDRGWTVRIDGQKVPAVRVFGTFMAVPVSEGTHTLDMRYVPAGLTAGVIISLISAGLYFLYSKKDRDMFTLPHD